MLRDLPDQGPAVALGHPVTRLDPLVARDRALELRDSFLLVLLDRHVHLHSDLQTDRSVIVWHATTFWATKSENRMHRVTIQYAVPADPAAFDEHYFERHLPMLAPVPGLQAFSWSKPRPLGGEHLVYLVAELDFADEQVMKAALASPAMAAAGADARALGVPMTMFSGEVHTTRP